MNTTETILESIAKDKITEAGETIQEAGTLAQLMLKVGEFIANNLWIILVFFGVILSYRIIKKFFK